MLLDACVLIDLAKGAPAAVAWLEGLPEDAPVVVSGIAYMELVSVVSTARRVGRKELDAGFRRPDLLWPSEAAGQRALESLRRLHPTHPIRDLLIAHTAIENGLPLVTTQERRFAPLVEEGLKILTPYAPAPARTPPLESFL